MSLQPRTSQSVDDLDHERLLIWRKRIKPHGYFQVCVISFIHAFIVPSPRSLPTTRLVADKRNFAQLSVHVMFTFGHESRCKVIRDS
jgi:hypothetical protein